MNTKIKELRKERKISQEQLALAVGTTRQTITSIEVGKYTASLALAYRVIDDRRWFVDVYAGARYNYFGVKLEATPDSGGLQDVSTAAVDRIASGIPADRERKYPTSATPTCRAPGSHGS